MVVDITKKITEDNTDNSVVDITSVDVKVGPNSSAILNEQIAEQRALKYSIALGDKHSPGQSAIKTMLMSNREDELRNEAVLADQRDRSEIANSLVQTAAGTPGTDEILVRELGRVPRKGKDSVLEENFASKATDLLFSLNDNEEFHEQISGMSADDKFNLVGQSMIDTIAKNEIVSKLYQDYEADYNKRGFFQKGHLTGIFVPFVTWMNMSNEIPIDDPALLPYSNLQQQIRKVWSLPVSEFGQAAKELIANVYNDNPAQGMQVLGALSAHSIPQGERILGNIGELAAIPGYGIAAKVLKGTSGLLLRKVVTPSQILSKVGKTTEAAEVAILKKELKKGLSVRTNEGIIDLADELPHMKDPQLVYRGAENDYKTFIPKYNEQYQKNMGLLTRVLHDPLPVATLEKGLMEAAIKKTRSDLETKYSKLGDTIRRVEEIQFDKTPSGVAHVEITLGNKDGTYFATEELANKVAQKLYGLKKGSYVANYDANGWGIVLSRDINERDASLLNLPIRTDNTSNNRDLLAFDLFRGNPKDFMSPFLVEQRGAAVHSLPLLNELLGEMAAPLRALNKTAGERLRKVLVANRDTNRIPGNPDTRGMFYHTLPELEEAYKTLNKVSVSDEEALAYFQFVNMMNVDYILRNLTKVREMARKGAMTYSIRVNGAEKTFSGIRLNADKLPEAKINVSAAIVDPKTTETKVYSWTNKTRKDVQDLMAKGKYSAIHVYDPLSKNIVDDDVITFVITKNEVEKPLSWKQIPHREGGHSSYVPGHLLVEPDIIKRGDKEIYAGDKIAFAINSEKSAAFIEEAMNTAKRLLKEGKTKEFEEYLGKNLPISPRDFKARVKSGYYNLNVPFAVVKSGSRSIETKIIKNQFPNAEDFRENPYNLARGDDPTFSQERGRIIQAFSENKDNGGYILEDAEQLDPLLTTNREMTRLIRNRFYEPLKMATAESAVEEFGKDGLLLYPGSKKTIPLDELRRNPIYHFQTADVSDAQGKTKQLQIRAIRKAHRNLIGQPGEIEQSYHSFIERLAKTFKDKIGLPIPNKMLGVVKDPFNFFKGAAFYWHMGLYNVNQVAVQSQTFNNLALLSPRYAAQGTLAASLQRNLLLTESGDIANFAAKKFTKLGIPGNFSEAEFLDSFKNLKKSGFDIVSQEHAYREDLSDPEFFVSSKGKRFFDKSTFFFTQTERFLRMSSWNTAYLEYIRKNGIKGPISAYDAAKIKVQAELFSGNMSRDAKSFWQTGVGGPISQFYGYYLRMIDLVTGTQLTMKQKASLLTGWSVLYGNNYVASIPYAVSEEDPGAVLNQFNPFGEDLRSYAMKNGIELDEGLTGLISNGVTASMYAMLTGNEVNIGERYGAAGNIDIFKQVQRKYQETDNPVFAMLEAGMGASGSTVGDIVRSSFPMIGHLFSVETRNLPTMLSDLVRIARTTSTGNATANLISAMQTGEYYSKNGTKQAEDIDAATALFHYISGLQPVSVGDTYRALGLLKKQEKRKSQAYKDITRYMRDYLIAYKAGNTEEADSLANTIDIIGRMGGMTPSEIMKAKLSALRNDTLSHSIFDKYIEGITDYELKEKVDKLLTGKDTKDRLNSNGIQP